LRQETAIFVENDVIDEDDRGATNVVVVYNSVHPGNEQFVEAVEDLVP
jgi:hypothetical protein